VVQEIEPYHIVPLDLKIGLCALLCFIVNLLLPLKLPILLQSFLHPKERMTTAYSAAGEPESSPPSPLHYVRSVLLETITTESTLLHKGIIQIPPPYIVHCLDFTF